MLDKHIETRFEFTAQPNEDKFGRHILGRRLADDAPVIFTVLDPQLNIDEEKVTRLLDDMKTLSQGQLSSVLYVFEAGKTEGGSIYMISQGCRIDPLKSLIRAKTSFPVGEALAIAYQIASTLREASVLGVPHYDLNSTNLFVQIDGDKISVKIARFGFRHLLPLYSPSLKSLQYIGTPEYLAPEICSGKGAGPESDIYSLGILMYEMVAGKPPFVSSNPATTLKRQVYEKPLPLHLVKPGMSGIDAYEKLVNALLVKEPKQRPNDPADVMEMIANCATNLPVKPLLEMPPPLDTIVEITNNLGVLQLQREEKETPKEPITRGTLMFTGFSETPSIQVKEEKPEEKPQVSVGEEVKETPVYERPTQLISTDIVREMETIKAQEEQVKEAEAPKVEETKEEEKKPEAVETTAQGEEEMGKIAEVRAKDAITKETVRKKQEDWFDKGDNVPPGDKEEKESKTFWIVLGVVAAFILVMVIVWLIPKGEETHITTPTILSPLDVVQKTITPQEKTPPPPHLPERSVEEIRAEKLRAKVLEAKSRLERGEIEDARLLLEGVLKEDPTNAEAKGLMAFVQKKMEEAQKPSEVAKPQPDIKPEVRTKDSAAPKPEVEKPTPPQKVTPAKKTEKPQVTSAPTPPPKPQMTDEEREEKVKAYIRIGREAYNRGDYQMAIKAYNQALSLDPKNALIPKLIEQAKAKASQ